MGSNDNLASNIIIDPNTGCVEFHYDVFYKEVHVGNFCTYNLPENECVLIYTHKRKTIPESTNAEFDLAEGIKYLLY